MYISTSLKNLLSDLATEHVCCRLIVRGIDRIVSGKKTRLLNPDLPGDYFTYREDEGRITYCPKGRTQVLNEDGTWKREGRQGMKPSKWLKEMIHPRLASRIPDHVIGAFANSFKAREAEGKITFAESDDFEAAYNKENWGKGKPASCMWGENVGGFYAEYGARILTASQGEEFVARAIIWPSCKIHGRDQPVTVMDRIYAASPEIEELMKNEARRLGYWHKARQNNSAISEFVDSDGCPDGAYMSVHPVSHWRDECSFWPYLDTFRWLDTSNGEITNKKHDPDDCEGWAELNGTDGDREINDHEGQVQDVDGDWIDENEAILVGDDYYHQNSDLIVTCHRSGEYILREEAYRIDLSLNETIYIHEDYVSRA